MKCHSFCYNYLTSLIVTSCLSLSHRLTTFSPLFTVFHMNYCGKNCGLICAGRIFVSLVLGNQKLESHYQISIISILSNRRKVIMYLLRGGGGWD